MSKQIEKELNMMGTFSAGLAERVKRETTKDVTKRVTRNAVVRTARLLFRMGQPRQEIVSRVKETYPELALQQIEQYVDEVMSSIRGTAE